LRSQERKRTMSTWIIHISGPFTDLVAYCSDTSYLLSLL
jgi:hypothetical protein